MKLESVPLTKLELDVINELRTDYAGLSVGLLESVDELFCRTRILLAIVVDNSSAELYTGQLALMGIIFRTYELLRGGIQQISQGNKHVWGACLRGLIETFGAAALVTENPDHLLNLIQGSGIGSGKLRNAAYKRLQALKDDIKRLDKIVHPGSTSLLLGLQVGNEAQRLAVFTVPPLPLSTDELEEAIETLATICRLIHEEVQALLEAQPEVIKRGGLLYKLCGGETH